MGSEQLPINGSQETANGAEPVNAGEEKAEVVYSGQYAQVVQLGNQGLLACPREASEWGEGDYLLRMIDELRGVYDKVTRNGELGEIYISALVELGGVTHTMAIGKGGDVRIITMEAGNYARAARVIRWADRVEISAADGGAVVYRGRYADVIEDGDGVLWAYARQDVGLGSRGAMLAVVEEVMRKFKTITKARDDKAVMVQGLVWRRGVAYRPVVHGHNAVGFKLVYGDYVDLAKGADLITFPRSVC